MSTPTLFVGSRRRRPWSMGARVLLIATVAATLAAALAVALPNTTTPEGMPDAGPLTAALLPAVKALFDLGAALTIGWLTAAVWWVPGQRSGDLTVGAFRAVRAASLSAWLWFVAALLLLPLTLTDVLGRPLSASVQLDLLLPAVTLFDTLRGYLIAAAAALCIALAGRVVVRSAPSAVLLIVAGIGVAALAFTGHAGGSLNHDLAVDLMIHHLLGVCLWLGGLVAVVGLVRQRIPHLDVVLRRYSATAVVVFAMVAVSGVARAVVGVGGVAPLFTSDYGRLVLLKAGLLAGLGVCGIVQRRHALPALLRGRSRVLTRWAAGELVIMAAAVAVAATLARTAPPAPTGQELSTSVLILGFDLPGPPTAWTLLTAWRPDLLLGVVAIAAALLYLRSVRILGRRGISWSSKRTTAWLTGCGLVLLATSSGLDRYAQTQFSLHMIVHMMIGMLAPIMLVMGGPITLMMRALRPAPRGGAPGLREAILTITHSRMLRVLSHPSVALPLFVGSFYAIYFTDLFSILISSHLGHVVMNVHPLSVGYLYYWLVIGVDPAPRRFAPIAKLALLMLTIPFHAVFGLALMNTRSLIAADYYQQLAMPWVTDLLADQKIGGAIAWALADIPTAVVIIALMSQWYRSDEREARRADRRADGRNDTELDAYNAMLAQLHHRTDTAGATHRVLDTQEKQS